ncbi:type IV secretory system conjugative DNA transfer family protein [Pseudonocardia sp.]|uniref:type IV secretory system conjugative DNA transfer family protein n=1 Tax=Pseudonocardia sp. TaxID=60912 RepID=UPI003D134AF9
MIDRVLPHLTGHAPAAVAVVLTAATVTTAAAAVHAVIARARLRRLHTGARLVMVLAPRRLADDGAQALWGNLAGLLRPRWRRLLFGQPHLAFEYRVTAEKATIQLWVPGPVPPGLVERAVTAAWPGTTTRTTPAPARARADASAAVVTGGTLRLARGADLPINDTVPGDPVTALLTAAGELPAGPRGEVVVQVLARPTPSRPAAGGTRCDGRLVVAASGAVGWAAREVLTLLAPGPVSTGRRPHTQAIHDPRTRLERFAADRAAVSKARAATFETLVRYAVSIEPPPGGDPEQARRAARGRAHAVAAVFASFTGHNFYRRRHLRRPAQAIAARRMRRGDLLSAAELAAIATLPAGHAPNLERAGARTVAPPPGIPSPGPEVKPLGDTTAGTARPVGLRVPDARHHLHVIGATGSGKSTLLVQLILADARARRGVVVIDPKGDLVTDVLARLPPPARGRVVLLDPDRSGPPPSLNPLPTADTPPNERALAVENLVAICRNVFSAYWGPRSDDVLRAACLTLAAQPTPRSLVDLPALLTDPAVRARALRTVTDPVLRGFWTGYERLSDGARAQVTAPLMNKVRALLLRPFTRAVLTTARPDTPAVDLPRILDGGILLARIPKGSLGEEGTRLVGSIVVAHTWAATTARARQPQPQRRDAALVIDECHNFLTLPHGIDDLLAEARGLRLSLTLAHQNLAQLPRPLRDGIATNARNKIFFTVGPDDARDLARHTTPHLDEHDLAHLDAFHAAARLVHHDAETPAFTLRTRPLPPPTRP